MSVCFRAAGDRLSPFCEELGEEVSHDPVPAGAGDIFIDRQPECARDTDVIREEPRAADAAA